MAWIKVIARDLKEFFRDNFQSKKGIGAWQILPSFWDNTIEFYWPKPKQKSISWWDNYENKKTGS